MSFTGLENNRIIFSLVDLATTTGWTIDGNQANHESCNDGNLYLLNYPVIVGKTYRYTFYLDYRTSGYVTTNFGAHQTVPGLIDETVVATDTQLYFYSNGTLGISHFNIELDEEVLPDDAQNTILFSEKENKWTSFVTIAPDSGFSMFTKSYLFQRGDAYVQENGTPHRCNFFGVQYPATIWFSTNQQSSLAKKYLSVNYQASQLLVTPPSGINTSHGEVSELIPIDFLQMKLDDGINPPIEFYSVENFYKANFLRGIPDIINGPTLIGNWLQIGLVTTSPSTIMNLFSTEIDYTHSHQNVR